MSRKQIAKRRARRWRDFVRKTKRLYAGLHNRFEVDYFVLPLESAEEQERVFGRIDRNDGKLAEGG